MQAKLSSGKLFIYGGYKRLVGKSKIIDHFAKGREGMILKLREGGRK